MLQSLNHIGFKVAKLQYDSVPVIAVFFYCKGILDFCSKRLVKLRRIVREVGKNKDDPYYLLILSFSSGYRHKQTERIPACKD